MIVPLEQRSMTVVVPIKQGVEESLKTLLRQIGSDIKHNPYIQFANFPTVHFARMMVVPPPDEGDPCYRPGAPSLLVFGTDHDGPDEDLLTTLLTEVGASLNTIYSYCEGWPTNADSQTAHAYLLKARIPYGARHIAWRGRTVKEFVDAIAVRDRMETYVDTQIRPARAGASDVPTSEQDAAQIAALRAHSTPAPPIAPPPPNWQIPAFALGAAAAIGGGLYLAFRRSKTTGWVATAALAALPAAALLALRQHEIADARGWTAADPPPLDRLTELRRWEDNQVQNQMTHVVSIKPGPFRAGTLRFVLAAINFLARYFWNRGELGGIPTIHFARWMIFDGGRRLLFFSNYDGSWENYLSDFIDRASVGLTGVWSNTVGFPPTKFLIEDGSRRAEPFKNWTRRCQIETQIWYSAYPHYSVGNLRDALALCQEPASAVAADLLNRL